MSAPAGSVPPDETEPFRIFCIPSFQEGTCPLPGDIDAPPQSG